MPNAKSSIENTGPLWALLQWPCVNVVAELRKRVKVDVNATIYATSLCDGWYH